MSLSLIWVSYFTITALLSLINVVNIDSDYFMTLVIGLHMSFVFYVLLKNKLRWILIGAFLVRIVCMLWDLYARTVFTLPHSGSDSEGFYYSALKISNDIELLDYNIYGSLWSKLLGIIYYVVGEYRIFGHYFNVLLGLTAIIILYRILILLEIRQNIIKFILTIYAFIPNTVIMSGILLRESIIIFFVTYSFYFFVKWFKRGNNTNMLFALIMLLVGAIFHAGVIGVSFGYVITYALYNRKKETFRFQLRTIWVIGLSVIMFFIIFVEYQSFFLEKFTKLEDSDIYEISNYRDGGSEYLTAFTIDTPLNLILYSPIKMLYFLIMPLPNYWRNIADVSAFLFDASLFIYIIYCFLKYQRYSKNRLMLIFVILLTLLFVTFVFSVGVSNTGTAIRHRQKVLPVFLVFLALMLDEKKSKQSCDFYDNRNIEKT